MNHTQTRAYLKLIPVALVAFVLAAILPLMAHAAPDGTLLTVTVKSAAGAKMSGVTVSAKMEGATITTSVFTDEDGAFYFPSEVYPNFGIRPFVTAPTVVQNGS